MRMSTIKQSVVPRSGQAKNSSAEANTLAVNPTERMKPRKDSRTDSSSSTIEMIGWCATLILILRGPAQRLLCVGTVLLYVGISGRREREGWLFRMGNTQLLGHSDEGCEGICAHLAHHLAAVDLHGDFAGAKLGRDLLVQPTRHD